MIILRAGESLVFRVKAAYADGKVIKPDQDTVVRVLAWKPGTNPASDEPAAEAMCTWKRLARSWEAKLQTGDWLTGTWQARVDASGWDAKGMACTEIEVLP